MNDITLEDLTLVAEVMGYEVEYVRCDQTGQPVLVLVVNGKIPASIYNPLTNDSQCMELMEKFEWLGIEKPMGEGLVVVDYRINLEDKHVKTVTGKTINEAVTRAMIAKVKA